MFGKNKRNEENIRKEEIAVTSEAIDKLVEIDLDKHPEALNNAPKYISLNPNLRGMFDGQKLGWCEMREGQHTIGMDETNYSTSIPYSALENVANAIKEEAGISDFVVAARPVKFVIEPSYKIFIENNKNNSCVNKVSTRLKVCGKCIHFRLDYSIIVPVYPTDSREFDEWFAVAVKTRVDSEFRATETEEIIKTVTGLLCSVGEAVVARSLESDIAKSIGIDASKVDLSLCGNVTLLNLAEEREEKIVEKTYTSLPTEIIGIMCDYVDDEE